MGNYTDRRRKAFGQHFLNRPSVIDSIVDRLFGELAETPCASILEIGPGKGAITRPIAEKLAETPEVARPRFVAVEKDRVIAAEWSQNPLPIPLSIVEGDFARLPQESWLPPGDAPLGIVANLPYSASTAILGELTRAAMGGARIPFMILMFQKEVADRILCAVPSRDSSALTVFTRNTWHVERHEDVPPSAFTPPPEVDSTVLVFRRKEPPEVPAASRSAPAASTWEKLVRTAFLHRRKMLRAALRSDQQLSGALKGSDVDETLRAEALTWKDWSTLMNRLTIWILFAAAVGLTSMSSLAPSARANIADAYGLGSQSSSLGGATSAWGGGAFSPYLNPAQMARPDGHRILFSWQTLWMSPQFKSVHGVVTENEQISDRVSRSPVDTHYRDTLGQSLGAVFKLLPDFYNLSFGVVSYLPIDRAAYFDSGEPYLPEYVLYRARTQRPQLETAFGLNFSPWFSAGLGLHTAFALTNQIDVFLQTDTAKTSSMRVRSSLKPKISPFVGFLLAPPDAEPDWTGALVVRAPAKSPIYYEVNSGAQALQGLSAVDINFSAVSIMQYDPLTLELGATRKFSSASRTYAQLEYQRWRDFEEPAIHISACQAKPCGLVIASSRNPARPFKDIIVPRVGHEVRLSDRTTVRAGYTYRPGILRDLSTGLSNYVDPPKHVVNVGIGFRFQRFMGKELPARLDLNAAYHHLVEQRITKSQDTEIGAPGYSVGGKIYGGGISLSLDI